MKQYFAVVSSDSLMHYGVKGMKWGQHLRRSVQNSYSEARARLHNALQSRDPMSGKPHKAEDVVSVKPSNGPHTASQVIKVTNVPMKSSSKPQNRPASKSTNMTKAGTARTGTYANGRTSSTGSRGYVRMNSQKLTADERKHKTVDTMRGKKRQGGR